MNANHQVREYLVQLLASRGDNEPFEDSDSLVMSGRLNSLEVVEILTFLETTFGYSMDPSEFDLSKFDSLRSIMELLSR